MTFDELRRRIPLVAYQPDDDEACLRVSEEQRASDWAAFAKLVREMLGPEEPLMADLVAVYERGTALADALEAAAQQAAP